MGRPMPQEQRRKISEALTGRKQTEEHRRNGSLAKKGKHKGAANPNWRHGECAEGPEWYRVKNANRLARKRGAEATLTIPEWLSVLDENDRLCVYCFDPFEELDHVIPLGKGGTSTKENVVPACRSCNRRKVGRASGWVPSIASRFWPHKAEELYA